MLTNDGQVNPTNSASSQLGLRHIGAVFNNCSAIDSQKQGFFPRGDLMEETA